MSGPPEKKPDHTGANPQPESPSPNGGEDLEQAQEEAAEERKDVGGYQ